MIRRNGKQRSSQVRSPRVTDDGGNEGYDGSVVPQPSMRKGANPSNNQDPLKVLNRKGAAAESVIRDIWGPNSSGFCVLSGPSFTAQQAQAIAHRGILSMAVNNVAGMARCTAFCCADPVTKFHHGIWLDGTIMKFVRQDRLYHPIRVKLPDGQFVSSTYRVSDCPNAWGYRISTSWDPESFMTSPAACWGNGELAARTNGHPRCVNTMLIAIRLMHFLGCKQIFLVGADFRMSAEYAYSFPQQRTAGAIVGNNRNYRITQERATVLRPILEQHGLSVYTCNRDSGLTAFDYVDFADAMTVCRNHVPDEPFDLSGWYEK